VQCVCVRACVSIQFFRFKCLFYVVILTQQHSLSLSLSLNNIHKKPYRYQTHLTILLVPLLALSLSLIIEKPDTVTAPSLIVFFVIISITALVGGNAVRTVLIAAHVNETEKRFKE